MEYVGIFYGRLVQFMTIWYNIWPFGIVCGHLVYTLFLFWYVWAKKNLATLMHSFRNARTVVRLKRKKRVLEFFFTTLADDPHLHIKTSIWDRCYDFKNIFAETFSENFCVFCSNFC
jgi:hypothetical protein